MYNNRVVSWKRRERYLPWGGQNKFKDDVMIKNSRLESRHLLSSKQKVGWYDMNKSQHFSYEK